MISRRGSFTLKNTSWLNKLIDEILFFLLAKVLLRGQKSPTSSTGVGGIDGIDGIDDKKGGWPTCFEGKKREKESKKEKKNKNK